MQRATNILILILLTGCAAPLVQPTSQTNKNPEARPIKTNIEALLIEAGQNIPPHSTKLILRATSIALENEDFRLVQQLIQNIESPYLSKENIPLYTIISATLALHLKDTELAVRLLDDKRFQDLELTVDDKIQANRLRARAYKLRRSYLASARELIQIDQFIPPEKQLANHEEIFSVLLQLSEKLLAQQSEISVTNEERGWLSLALMIKRYQYSPLQQLNALKEWQLLWAQHPAALVPPSSLNRLAQIVRKRPKNIALMLPLQGELGKLGRAIRDGYIAAHYAVSPAAQLSIYDSTTTDVINLINQAHQQGAEVVVGPLDRDRVTRVALHSLPIPVIALNRTREGEINPNLYQFGLAPEDEARQVANKVISEGKIKGVVIAPSTDWGQRNIEAFTEEFTANGGEIINSALFAEQRDYSNIIKALLNVDESEARAMELRRITGERYEFAARRRQDIDFVFLLASPLQARGINPTLAFFYAEDIPVYATSHVHNATSSRIDTIDMNGIRFCDIPWKLSSEDPLQVKTVNTWPEASNQLAPFFALGVDAHRLYPLLEHLKENPTENVFGSTGILSVNEQNVVQRSLTWARFQNGQVNTIPMTFSEGE